MVLSCVRCNGAGAVGFLADRRRLCVALSRARARLVVVGSAATLRSDPVWRAVHAAAAQDPRCS